MKLSYSGRKTRIREATDFVNRLMTNEEEEFFSHISARAAFDESTASGRDIVNAIKSHQGEVRVFVRPNPYPSVNGWTKKSAPGKLFYNIVKLRRPVSGIVNTLVHELIHLVDHSQPGREDEDFGHGDNEAEGKENCAPNWIGDLAEKLYDQRT